jgi:hypothetical protein
MANGAVRRTRLGAQSAAETRAEIERLTRLARLMDTRFRLPFVPIRFGLDTILGLVPGVGDAATALPALYLIYRGYKLGVPRSTLVAMAANVGLDVTVGSIPVIGDAFDLFFKANRRNAHHLQRHLERLPPEATGVDAAV